MAKKRLDHTYVCKEYTKKERSTFDIAQELGTHPNTIRRILIKNNVTIRNRSQAQKNQLERKGHPMAGKTRSKQEKRKISDGMRHYWDGLSVEEQEAESQRRSEIAKDQWEGKTKREKVAMIDKMNKANYKTTFQGSRNENKIAELLEEEGYSVLQRTNDYTPGNQFEIDICLWKQAIAIEVDGKTHYEAIYGEDRLAKVKKADRTKNNILLGGGFTVIRLLDKTTCHSLAACTRAVDSINEIVANKKKHKKLHKIDLK